MNNTMNFIVFLFIAGTLAFAVFIIYIYFKIVQFILTATNLYKKMVTRLEAVIKLLMDIRDNTKDFKFIKEY